MSDTNRTSSTAAPEADRAVLDQALRNAEQASRPEEFATADRNEDLLYKASTRKFRGWYAGGLLALLIVQLIATNGVFIAVGKGCLTYDPVTLRIFVGATVAQIVTLVLVIVRHLFPITRNSRG